MQTIDSEFHREKARVFASTKRGERVTGSRGTWIEKSGNQEWVVEFQSDSMCFYSEFIKAFSDFYRCHLVGLEKANANH